MPITTLQRDIAACSICTDQFAKTRTAHAPRPTIWFEPPARILIAGQAPGARVHESGKPFTDPSGDRLRDWMGIGKAAFYDRATIAILPMAFCFPGYNATGSDLPPPSICAKTWHDQVLALLPNIRLTLLVGGYAQKHHLGPKTGSVTQTVEHWRDYASSIIPLPHPSWRNTGWIKQNPWFQAELLPVLKTRVREVLAQ